MIVVVFRSRMNCEHQTEYAQWAGRMSTLAKTIPGHVSHKGFIAEDGERVTIVEFDTEEAMRSWASHPQSTQLKTF